MFSKNLSSIYKDMNKSDYELIPQSYSRQKKRLKHWYTCGLLVVVLLPNLLLMITCLYSCSCLCMLYTEYAHEITVHSCDTRHIGCGYHTPVKAVSDLDLLPWVLDHQNHPRYHHDQSLYQISWNHIKQFCCEIVLRDRLKHRRDCLYNLDCWRWR